MENDGQDRCMLSNDVVDIGWQRLLDEGDWLLSA